MNTSDNWRATQDTFVREVLSIMGRRRMNGRALCEAADLSTSHWSEMKNLQKPISLDRMARIATALGMRIVIEITP